jgi:protein-S-isoprenylcysteine O-methyltransferase
MHSRDLDKPSTSDQIWCLVQASRRPVSPSYSQHQPSKMAHQGDPDISLPSPTSPTDGTTTEPRTPLVDPTIYPGNSRSISAIALHAFCLGITLSTCTISTILLAQSHHRIWRLTEFIATLSLFHFLEFWITARYNTFNAKVSSYLLTSNGSAYLSAHLAAMLEIIITSLYFPSLQDSWSNTYTVLFGLTLVLMGQVVRSIAMAQAGVSFNHIPAKSKKTDHVLVTKGLYSYLRHPSYFGYFFFAVGTQVVVGNKICCVSYLIILWFFFKDRINCKSLLLFSTRWRRWFC